MDDSKSKERVIQRLKRIEGQIRGIQRMIESDQYCLDVLTQISAARAALNKVGMLVFEEHSHSCLTEAIEKNQEEAIDQVMQALKRFI